jgi:muramoyltetrapeptide carboxypeptidase LdcA involved in peptidoglycan recycling
MEKIFPKNLKSGDEIRVIAPSSSLGIIGDDVRKIANERFASLGLTLSFSKHVAELDAYGSSPIKSRIEDLHDAFLDPAVKGVICVIGGFNSNQLLPYINWDIIRSNPKAFIGYSDITVLHNAILAHAGLTTYLGPAYSTFGQKLGFEPTMEYFKRCLMQKEEFSLATSPKWSDDQWYLDQERRIFLDNPGPNIIQPGKATGELVGGNLSSFSLLFGTPHMPSLEEKILCVEDDEADTYKLIDRNFEALLQQPGADLIAGIIIGRFQNGSGMDEEKTKRLIALRPQLQKIPIISQLDFGHTSPIATLPLGGIVSIDTSAKDCVVFKKF